MKSLETAYYNYYQHYNVELIIGLVIRLKICDWKKKKTTTVFPIINNAKVYSKLFFIHKNQEKRFSNCLCFRSFRCTNVQILN